MHGGPMVRPQAASVHASVRPSLQGLSTPAHRRGSGDGASFRNCIATHWPWRMVAATMHCMHAAQNSRAGFNVYTAVYQQLHIASLSAVRHVRQPPTYIYFMLID